MAIGTYLQQEVGSPNLRMSTKRFTNADILAMDGQYVELVPAPGPNRVLRFVGAFLSAVWNGFFSSVPAGGKLEIQYTDPVHTPAGGVLMNDAAATPALDDITRFFGNVSGVRFATIRAQQGIGSGGVLSGKTILPPVGQVDNTSLVVLASLGGMTGGNASNFMIISTLYIVEPYPRLVF